MSDSDPTSVERCTHCHGYGDGCTACDWTGLEDWKSCPEKDCQYRNNGMCIDAKDCPTCNNKGRVPK